MCLWFVPANRTQASAHLCEATGVLSSAFSRSCGFPADGARDKLTWFLCFWFRFLVRRPQGAMFNPALVRAEIRLSISEILMQQKDRISKHKVQEERIFINSVMNLWKTNLLWYMLIHSTSTRHVSTWYCSEENKPWMPLCKFNFPVVSSRACHPCQRSLRDKWKPGAWWEPWSRATGLSFGVGVGTRKASLGGNMLWVLKGK